MDGDEAIFDNAKQSQAAGIAIIFQEPTLFPDPERRREHLRRGAAAQALPPHRRAADATWGGHALRAARRQARPDRARPRALRIADQQLVEIAKALTRTPA